MLIAKYWGRKQIASSNLILPFCQSPLCRFLKIAATLVNTGFESLFDKKYFEQNSRKPSKINGLRGFNFEMNLVEFYFFVAHTLAYYVIFFQFSHIHHT